VLSLAFRDGNIAAQAKKMPGSAKAAGHFLNTI
jgi:hypothetical protein